MDSTIIFKIIFIVLVVVIFGYGVYVSRRLKSKTFMAIMIILTIILLGSGIYMFVRKEKFQNDTNYKLTCPSGLSGPEIEKYYFSLGNLVAIYKNRSPGGKTACFSGNGNDCWYNSKPIAEYFGGYKGIARAEYDSNDNEIVGTCLCGDCTLPK